jgi:hypothetical protein
MGFRTILIVPLDLPVEGYRAWDVVRAQVTTQYPVGTPLPLWPFSATVHRPSTTPEPDGTIRVQVDQWYFRTDEAGQCEVPLLILPGQPLGPWTLNVFHMRALPDGSWDGDGFTFQVVR